MANKPVKKKAQSAMEYLITYGWAILLIAIVAAALYQLGLFNTTQGPRAQPGGCQVVRPNGPFTNQFISLSGLCIGELPAYVVNFQSAKNYFNISENVQIPGNQMTITAWALTTTFVGCGPGQSIMASKTAGYPSTGQFILSINNISKHDAYFYVWNSPGPTVPAISLPNSITLNTWYFLAGVYNGINASVWINGQQAGAVAKTGNVAIIANNPPTQQTNIGAGTGSGAGCHWFHGSVANVQLYTSALSANALKQLYVQGIGSAPINLQSLYGWWPLNGNANDYSGDGLNGGPVNVSFSSTWSSAYIIP